MKKFLVILLAGFILVACTVKEDATAATSPVNKVKEDTTAITSPVTEVEEVAVPTTKKICKDVKDKAGNVVKNKDGTVKQTCKTIKVHKKFEGTKVPQK